MPNYTIELDRCARILQEFATSADDSIDDEPRRKYMHMLQEVANRTRKVVEIDLDDVYAHGEDEELVHAIETNTNTYLELFAQAVDNLMPEPTVQLENEDIFDVLQSHRQQQQELAQTQSAEEQGGAPLRIVPRAKGKALGIRDVGADHIGSLVSITGIVTRVTDVKPLVTVATYTCDKCGQELYQEVLGRTFMPVSTCPGPNCGNNNKNVRLHMQTRGSKFEKYQELRIQENAEQVPMGQVPRSLVVHLRGELTRSCLAGDFVTIDGIFLPTPFTGYRAIRAGLVADVYLEAQRIEKLKKNYSEQQSTPQLMEQINAAANDRDVYEKLARSIAPEIYGHEDVKKALLLQLCGGVGSHVDGEVQIRGDVHICLMGDPGVAKSQLLKHISKVAPRCVYTTGKGSSGVGLTAAVLRDPFTGELVLEGGALVLADRGICCIDEFDKMEEADRTAIHEVMEQQTVSIAKAGITTTLNARTAVLAAANPAYSRYNPHRSPAENIDLPAALLSRFDLMFVILDKPNPDSDLNLARHVLFVHQNLTHPQNEAATFEPKFIREYVAQARRHSPVIPADLSDHIVSAYTSMRQEELNPDSESRDFTYTTPRTLLSILRLAQSLARLRFASEVTQYDVDEAIRLMISSKASLYDVGERRRTVDPISAIYSIIRDYAAAKNALQVKLNDVLQMVIAKGFSQSQLNACVEEYDRLNVWQANRDRSRVTFVA